MSVTGAIMAAGAVGSAAISAHGASSAASKQTAAGQQALGLQQPYLNAGSGAISQLSSLTAPGGSLVQPYGPQFTAPTDVTEQNDPGFQFRLQQGQQALERSAAAKGGLLSGGTVKAEQRYAQDYASNEYQNVYNRALGEYQQAYNIFQNDQANQYGRLMGVAGLGQSSAVNAGNILGGIGNAQAAGAVGSANAWAGGLQGALGSLSSGISLNNSQP